MKKHPKQKFHELTVSKLSRKSLEINMLIDSKFFEMFIIYFDHIFTGEHRHFWGLDSFVMSIRDDEKSGRREYIKRVASYRNAVKESISSSIKSGKSKDPFCIVEKVHIIEYVMRHIIIGLNGSPKYDESFIYDLNFIKQRSFKDLQDYYFKMEKLGN